MEFFGLARRRFTRAEIERIAEGVALRIVQALEA